MKRPSIVMVCLALAALGCNRSSKEPASDKASSTASVASPAASSAKGPDVSNALTEEDFEDEAERQITADNIEAELEALAKEISQK